MFVMRTGISVPCQSRTCNRTVHLSVKIGQMQSVCTQHRHLKLRSRNTSTCSAHSLTDRSTPAISHSPSSRHSTDHTAQTIKSSEHRPAAATPYEPHKQISPSAGPDPTSARSFPAQGTSNLAAIPIAAASHPATQATHQPDASPQHTRRSVLFLGSSMQPGILASTLFGMTTGLSIAAPQPAAAAIKAGVMCPGKNANEVFGIPASCHHRTDD